MPQRRHVWTQRGDGALRKNPSQTLASPPQEEEKFNIWNANVEETVDLNIRAKGSVFYAANALL